MCHLTVLWSLILTGCCIGEQDPPKQLIDSGSSTNPDESVHSVFSTNNWGTDRIRDHLAAPTPEPGSLDDLTNKFFSGISELTEEGSQSNKNDSDNAVANNNNHSNNVRSDDGCICIPYFQCRNGTIFDDGADLIDSKSSLTYQPGKASPGDFVRCNNYLEICCKLPKIAGEKKRNGCGRRNRHGVGLQVIDKDSKNAKFGEFPWMVAVLIKEPIEENSHILAETFQCGGSLIHPKAVLTSAYCVFGKNTERLLIRAGEWDTRSQNEAYPHQDRGISEVIIHENFNPDSLHNDFAILILSSPVELAEHIDAVCLPYEDDRFNKSACLASGWGKNVFRRAGQLQPLLKRIEFSIIPHRTCQDSLRKTRLGHYFVLNPSFICATSKDDRDTCMGDGGGPLVCPLLEDPTRYVQAGIVSWGIGCGTDVAPGVYANVLAARKWIDEKMSNHNLNDAYD